MSEPNSPTLLYPNGGESISTNELTIRWLDTTDSTDGRAIVYELYYTTEYRADEEPDWLQIAVVPEGETSFVWRFGKALKSNRCRVGIVARNTRGDRSDFSVSADNFTIQRKKLASPTVLSPISNERYDKYIEIMVDDSGIRDTYSQRSYYQFFYSSVSAGIAPTSIAQNIPIGADPVLWSTIELSPANDYVLQVFLSDDDGNVSDSVFIRNLNISHEGFFIIDTTPPVSAIIVNDNDVFTTKQDVSVNIVSYDAATGVHSMLLTDGETESKPDAVANIKRFVLSEGDEIKSVQLRLQDFGGNRNDDDNKIKRLFEVVLELDDTEIADIALDRDESTLWAVTNGTSQYLYKITDFPARTISLDDEPTAVAVYKSAVWVATKSDLNSGLFNLYDGSQLVETKAFAEADSTINSMEVHGDYLFLGMENGDVYRFDGILFDKVDSLLNPVRYMFSDGNLLYLVQKNDFDVYIFNGTSFFDTGA
jgi:hypothetical protein